MSARDTLLRTLRVPPTPEPPPGSPPRIFRAAPRFLTLRLLHWGLKQLVALVGVFWAIYFFSFLAESGVPNFAIWMMRAGEAIAITALFFNAVLGWMIVRLDYDLRWYMVSDRAIRIREGITTIREKTIALANIQNIAIKQGPLQRLLGIADVEVKTAGGGGNSTEGGKKGHVAEPLHVAYFRGVDNADEIRDLLREGVRRQKDAGLGDPDEEVVVPAGGVSEAVGELLAEARALRQTVSGVRYLGSIVQRSSTPQTPDT
ncbi:MAG TPA: PH domain-containing protein [Thermoanaerobaculia bacterium]|nr:PH domain-containing protein [Thermoanaerobaculia bacterium]